jgi:hypothetical protein
VTIKDTNRYADTTHEWGYYNFNQHEPKLRPPKFEYRRKRTYCDIASARKDDVWILFYHRLGKCLRSFASPEVKSPSGKNTMETTDVTTIAVGHSRGSIDSRDTMAASTLSMAILAATNRVPAGTGSVSYVERPW